MLLVHCYLAMSSMCNLIVFHQQSEEFGWAQSKSPFLGSMHSPASHSIVEDSRVCLDTNYIFEPAFNCITPLAA